jgi:hypothetical protein
LRCAAFAAGLLCLAAVAPLGAAPSPSADPSASFTASPTASPTAPATALSALAAAMQSLLPSATPTPTQTPAPSATPTPDAQGISAHAAVLDAQIAALEAGSAAEGNGSAPDAAVSGTAGNGEANALSASAEAAPEVSSGTPGPDAGTPSGAAGDEAKKRPPKNPQDWSQSGLEYRFSVGAVKLYNGNALSYMPIELGWRFANGLRLRFGMEAYYYEGMDTDTYTGSYAPQMFYYQMTDLRLSALYAFRKHSRIRPLAGIVVEQIGSVQSFREVVDSINPPDGPHSAESLGPELGLEYRGGPSWALSLEARGVLGFGLWSSLVGGDFGWHYYFF